VLCQHRIGGACRRCFRYQERSLELYRTGPLGLAGGVGGGPGFGAGVLARELPRVHLSVGHWPLPTTTAATMVGRTIMRVPTMRTRITWWTTRTTLSPSVAVHTTAALHTIAELTRVLATPT